MKSFEKLDQLTSLRFFAAAMVVICHMAGVFGFTAGPRLDSLGTGVSFFFVLSGFILVHVYPDLQEHGAVSGFLRARIARIWPGHLITFLLAIWLLQLPWDGRTALANIFLVQAWNPFSSDYFSYNSPSWSLSTEIFFYLAFPFLILDWNRKWPLRVLVSGLLLLTIIAYVSIHKLANGGPSFLYINPAARIFEFIFGMLLQHAWQRYRSSLAWSFELATKLEVAAIGFCALSIYRMPDLAEYLRHTWTGPGLSSWLENSGSMFGYGSVIFVMAIGRGWVSRLLSRPWFIVLGEISFSIYLLHQIFLRVYLNNLVFFPRLPNPLAFMLFWVFLLLSSYVMWSWLEMPARRAIIQRHPWHWLSKHWQPRRWFVKRWQPRVETRRRPVAPRNAQVRRTWREYLLQNRGPAAAGMVLACFVLIARHEFESIRTSVPVIGSAESKARTAALMGRLMRSINTEDVATVRWLLDSGLDPNSRDSAGSLPLVEASFKGTPEVVELLLGKGADPRSRSRNGITPIMAAAMQSHAGIVRRLTRSGGDINVHGNDGSTPLIYAATQGDRNLVNTLLSLGADVNATRGDGYSALFGASVHGNPEIVRTLARKGANVDGRDKDGTTSLMIATWNGDRSVVNVLLELGANPNAAKADGYTALIGAAMQGNPDIVRSLAGKGADVNCKASDGNTPLMIAAWKGDRIVVDVLLSFSADINATQPNGLTALMLAAMGGHGDIVEALARKGAKVNVVNANGATPLMLAAWAGKRDLVELLISMGADIGVARKDGRTAIDLARMGKHPEIVTLLAAKARAGRGQKL